MDTLLFVLHLLAYLLTALALPLPRLRQAAIGALLLAGLGSIGSGLLDGGERALTTVHTYAGFEGINQEISMVRFPTGTVTAKSWQWPLPFGGFALLWVFALSRLGSRELGSALRLPLLLAWTATASWLGMQHFAAPEILVQPLGLDRFLWPAGLAAALLAARLSNGYLRLFVTISSATLLSRLPAALFSKFASDNRLGTCLDISSVRDIVNPLTQMQFEPRLEAGSSAQQFWLIWLEHVIFFPGVYLLSLFGIAFGTFLFHRHGPETAR
jgi:hypothetical protein